MFSSNLFSEPRVVMFKKMLSNAAMRLMVIKGESSLKRLENSSRDPMEENLRLLKKIIRTNKNTAFGKAHDFASIKTVEDFRARVPESVYEDYAEDIEKVKDRKAENLLTASKILGYSRTSGSSGVPKFIPATTQSLKAYTRYTWTRALALGARELKKQGKKFVPGRGVFLSPATNELLPDGTICSNIAEIGARKFGFIYPYILTVPTKNIFDVHDGDYIYEIYRFALADDRVTFFFSVFFSVNVSQIAYLMENWQTLVDDIEKGTVSDSVKLKPEVKAALMKHIKPMPERGKYLRAQFEQGFDSTLFKRLWPNLTVMSGVGNASFKPSADYVRGLCEGVPFDFSIYGASEALVGSVYQLEDTDMQLLTDSCFYEFVPYDDSDSDRHYLTLDQLVVGGKYEILITTQAGLYRYKLKDILEVKGFRGKSPLISFVFRKGQLFNIAGEKFSEEDARTSIDMFEKAHGVKLDGWLFYQDDSVMPSRYALVVESDLEIDWDSCIDEIEGYIGYCNKRYPGQREKAFISRLVVQKQQPGTHAAWAQRCVDLGASAAQVKPVHSLDNEEKKKFFLSRLSK